MGSAVRYRPLYTVDRPSCIITGEAPIHALDTSVSPYTIIARQPTSITVSATDRATGNPVSGKVLINNAVVGDTNTPFTYTFDSSTSGTVQVSSYPDIPVSFSVSNPLSVSANPAQIKLSTPVTVFISANDPITHAPVAGKVMSNELPLRGVTLNQIGITNTKYICKVKYFI